MTGREYNRLRARTLLETAMRKLAKQVVVLACNGIDVYLAADEAIEKKQST